MTKVVATAPVPPAAHRAFAEIGPISQLRDVGDLAHAEVLLVRAEPIGRDDIAQAMSLRVIARTGSGVDNVDVSAATARHVPVLFAPDAGARPVAEGTMALILAASKRLRELHALLEDGQWARRYEIEGLDLYGATLGLVGLGRIGREVGRLAEAFGMKVIAYDPPIGGSDAEGIRLVELRELLATADVLSLHCPLTPATRGLVDERFLQSVKAGAILVNTARGEVIADDGLLTKALDEGRLSAVALDVFETEPLPPSSPLLADPRVICSPHAIGLTREWNRLVFSSLANDVSRFLRGEPPVNIVDESALDHGSERLP